MSSERKILARDVARLENELVSLTRGRGDLFGHADRSHLQAVVAQELADAIERLRACDDLPGQRNLFEAAA
jgi:hypothetical protein